MNGLKSLALVFIVIAVSCGDGKKYHDAAKKEASAAKSDKVAAILQFQEDLNAEFKNPEESPLPDRFRIDFETLDFFEPDTSFVVIATLVRTPEALPFLMPTSTDRKSKEKVYGIAKFMLNGMEHSLELYQNPALMQEKGYEDYLFLPYTDLTNGEQTYGGGRYLDLRIPEGNTIVLDFNRSYNPYCAYNKKYSCPLVPSVNKLATEVLAGVKDFRK